MENLYSLVNKTTTNDTKLSKIQFGYSVDNYKGVLEALKTAQANAVEYDDNVSGDDYGGLSSLGFDNNDMAEDSSACIWKMELGLFGSLPILYKDTQKYDVVCVKGDQDSHISSSGCNTQLPLILAADKVSPSRVGGSFTAGCYVDIDNLLVTYMNKFYTGAGADFTFTADICWQLVHKKCLVAQIIPANGGSSAEVLIVGKTQSSGGRLLLNPPVAVSGNLQSLGLTVKISGQGISDTVHPEGSKYRCPISNNSYSNDNGTVKDLTHNKYLKEWLAASAVSANVQDCLDIEQLPADKYYVKIYIPSSRKGLADGIIPAAKMPFNLFQSYTIGRFGTGNIPAGVNADVRRILECIQEACVKHNCKLFLPSDIKDMGQGGQIAFGSDGRWATSYRKNTQAMSGHFYIPVGWPMCPINQNFGGRSAQVQRRKGHPDQDSSSKAAPWVVVESQQQLTKEQLNERLDGELSSLSGQKLSGSMPREWYQERIRRSNIGRIKVYCNSASAQQFQSFFDEMWMIYGTAATIYNTGRPQDEQISTGEVLLRAAPCLCAINGTSPLHRDREDSNSGHGGGSAIDFDPSNNFATSNLNAHLGTPITKNMEVAYRPMLDVLYRLGGGWGGSYKFDCLNGGRRFDAMHIQF